ncbi:uncharacterized protein M6B38_311930 [Iris pallida]|uniref:Uncharacterized protein n=1 Tax=Iris pallida TaxID=29817 RepID=A0AAX6HGL8_IRIPA|nr:uncharacterized protein M6B38_311930 [Iris pallida]
MSAVPRRTLLRPPDPSPTPETTRSDPSTPCRRRSSLYVRVSPLRALFRGPDLFRRCRYLYTAPDELRGWRRPDPVAPKCLDCAAQQGLILVFIVNVVRRAPAQHSSSSREIRRACAETR